MTVGRDGRQLTSTLWSLFGSGIYAAAQFAIVSMLARGVGAEAVGAYALGLAVAVPVFALSGLQLRSVALTDPRLVERIVPYFVLRAATSALALIVIGLVVVVAGYAATTASAIVILAVVKAVESLSEVSYAIFQIERRLDLVAWSQVLRAVLFLVCVTAALLGAPVYYTFAGMAVAAVITLVAFDLPLTRRTLSGSAGTMATSPESSALVADRWPGVLAHVREILPDGLTLGLALMFMMIATSAPRYVLERTSGLAAVGYFAAVTYPGSAVALVVGAAGQAAAARLAASFRANRADYWYVVRRLALVAVAMGLALVGAAAVFGRPILRLVYGEAYADQHRLFVVASVAAALWSLHTVLGYAATATRMFRGQLVVSVIVSAIAVAAAALATPEYGLLGAAMANLVAASVSIALFASLLRLASVRTEGTPSWPSPEPGQSHRHSA